MCTFPPLSGWNGVVIEAPSGDMVGLWFLLLAPLVLPPFSYLARPLAEAPFPIARVSYRPPTLRWYAIQTTVLSVTFSTLVFVIFPSDTLRRAWYAQAQSSVQPGCQVALDALNLAYVTSGGLVVMLGVLAPWLIFVVSVLAATYARERPHP